MAAGELKLEIPSISYTDANVSFQVKGVTLVFDTDEFALAYAKARTRILNKRLQSTGLPAAATLKGDAGRKRSRRPNPQLFAGLRVQLRRSRDGFQIVMLGRYGRMIRNRQYVNKRLREWRRQFDAADHAEAVKRSIRTLTRRKKKREQRASGEV